MSIKRLANRLYSGEHAIQFVGRRRLWFAISALACLVSLAALVYPGLNLGIDFKGGSVFRAEATRPVTVQEVRDAIGPQAKVVQVTEDRPPRVIVQTEEQPPDQVAQINARLERVTGAKEVSTDAVGSKWGETVSRKALIALAAFIVAIAAYVSLRFEPKMAVAALVALFHDLLITAGIYALARFEVTPATVIALLTILGYSLYDTVVVFDKVKENTGRLGPASRTTYADAANLAVNQTAVRSLNTSLTSLLPIGALLAGGILLAGGEVLEDLSLALFVGVGAGTYSSMFLAVPLLVAWKEREPRNRDLRARAERRARPGTRKAATPATTAGQARPANGTAANGTAGKARATTGAATPRRGRPRRAAPGGALPGTGAPPSGPGEEPLLPAVPPDPDDDYVSEDEAATVDPGDRRPAGREPAAAAPGRRPARTSQRRRKGGKGGKQPSGGKRRRR